MMRTRSVLSILIVALGGIMFSLFAIDTLLPFHNIALQSLLLQSNDLPASLSTGDFELQGQDSYWHYDIAGKQTIVSAPNEVAGQVWVYIFHSIKDGNKMFDFRSLMESREGIIPYETPLIGDRVLARQGDLGESGKQIIDLTFRRCYAVVHIQLQSTGNYRLHGEDLIAYAQKLDKRLQNITCSKVKNLLGR